MLEFSILHILLHSMLHVCTVCMYIRIYACTYGIGHGMHFYGCMDLIPFTYAHTCVWTQVGDIKEPVRKGVWVLLVSSVVYVLQVNYFLTWLMG